MSSQQLLRLTLVSRSYCSLCDKMRKALYASASTHNVVLALSEIDLDDFPAHEDKYGERVPILMAGTLDQANEICHYHLDEVALSAYISRCATSPA